jgi:hypothetical protein
MELVAISLSLPLAFLASLVYCYFLERVVARFGLLRQTMWIASAVVLLVFGVEIILLVTLGAVRSRALIGPVFYLMHVVLFFLGTPALANLLVLKRPAGFVRWYWAVPICALFAFALVLLQYGVSEALYGVDGIDT